MKKDKFTIFFSWQSDNKPENKHPIKKCLKCAVKKIKKNKTIDVVLDEGTNQTFGSPHITTIIFNKIDKCDIFVCDISIINSTTTNPPDIRLTPNPNVLMELGYAVNLLGWERIICINNLKFGKIEELPFDVRGNRISHYDSSSPDYESDLEGTLSKAINVIIDNYDQILTRHNSNDIKLHDRAITSMFLEICSEETLIESISRAVSQMRATQNDYFLWGRYEVFYEKTLNKFINADLDTLVEVLILRNCLNLYKRFPKEFEFCGANHKLQNQWES